MPTDSQRQPLLSLVVLVKNQASELQRLLSEHEHLCDETVVVDTGSTDHSAAIARQQGATVTSFPWCNDFSAARNHGLEQARGQWILVLDCDEAIAASDFSFLRELCGAQAKAWEFSQRNYCGLSDDAQWVPLTRKPREAPVAAQGYIDAPTCRLFPRRSDVYYEGTVHEMPNPSLARAGITVRPSGVVVHHAGHLIADSQRDEKKRLYGNILRDKLKANPQDPITRFEMAVQLLNEGHPNLAKRLLVRTISEAPHHAAVHRARLLLGRLLLDTGDNDRGIAEFAGAVRDWPDLRESWIGAARAHLRLHQFERASAYMRQGRYLFPADEALRALENQVSRALADIG